MKINFGERIVKVHTSLLHPRTSPKIMANAHDDIGHKSFYMQYVTLPHDSSQTPQDSSGLLANSSQTPHRLLTDSSQTPHTPHRLLRSP
jgi:hypothetical protein